MTMEDDDPRGMANLDPRGMICRIYVEYHLKLLHTKYTPNKISNWSPYILMLVSKVKIGYTKFVPSLNKRRFCMLRAKFL